MSASSLSSSQRHSLTSSRPAPPSPAVSRRTSAALSRHSSKSARQSKDIEGLTASATVTPVAPNSPSTKHRSWLVKVKDFAFSQSDERHEGRGPDVPRPNRPRHRFSTLSSSSSSAPEDTDDRDDELGRHGWGSLRWSTLSSHLKFGSGSGGNERQPSGPSHTDFERNFDVSSPLEQPQSENSDGEDDEEDEYDYPDEDQILVPGLYRALYAFEPEGAAEMALEEGQMINIIARGGGVGWAVVEKEDGEHALVPESYLELVQAAEQ